MNQTKEVLPNYLVLKAKHNKVNKNKDWNHRDELATCKVHGLRHWNVWTWRWWRHLPNVIRLPTLGRCVAKYFPSWQIRCAFPNSIVIFLVWPTIDLWKPNATALPMALCVSFSFDYFSEFHNDYFFCVYKLHSTQARQNVYALHVVWQTVVCNLFCVL